MNVPVFTLPNYCYRCKVVKVVDGDTIDVDIDLGFNILNFTHVGLGALNLAVLELHAEFIHFFIYNSGAECLQREIDRGNRIS